MLNLVKHTQIGFLINGDGAKTASKPKNTGSVAVQLEKSLIKKKVVTSENAYVKNVSKPPGPKRVWVPKSN